MSLDNHQATDTKKGKFTIIVLKSTNPYLLDRVEFKHQFVNFKAGHVIYIKKLFFPYTLLLRREHK